MCPKPGVFTLLLTMTPPKVSEHRSFLQTLSKVFIKFFWVLFICIIHKGFKDCFIFISQYLYRCIVLSAQVTNKESNPQHYILVIGCSLCMLLALFTTACLAASCWIARRSCLVALKLQCSFSVFVIGLLFTLAAVTGPPQVRKLKNNLHMRICLTSQFKTQRHSRTICNIMIKTIQITANLLYVDNLNIYKSTIFFQYFFFFRTIL